MKTLVCVMTFPLCFIRTVIPSESLDEQITESHQSAKVDTSGTAKALAADFATLTAEDYNVKSINKASESCTPRRDLTPGEIGGVGGGTVSRVRMNLP